MISPMKRSDASSRSLDLPGREIPHPNDVAIGARHRSLSIVRRAERKHPAGLLIHDVDAFAGLDVPEAHCPVLARADGTPWSCRPHAADIIVVSRHHANEIERGGLPHAHGAVVGAAEEVFPVRRERHAVHRRGVVGLRVKTQRLFDVPDADRSVFRSRHEDASVGRERERLHERRVLLEDLRWRRQRRRQRCVEDLEGRLARLFDRPRLGRRDRRERDLDLGGGAPLALRLGLRLRRGLALRLGARLRRRLLLALAAALRGRVCLGRRHRDRDGTRSFFGVSRISSARYAFREVGVIE